MVSGFTNKIANVFLILDIFRTTSASSGVQRVTNDSEMIIF